MTSTISRATAKNFLRVDHAHEDNLIQALLDGAETYIRSLCVDFVDIEGEWDTLPQDLQTAVLLMTSHWYDNRGIISRDVHEIPFSVSAIIANHRDYDDDAE